jgi:hypothetical protein
MGVIGTDVAGGGDVGGVVEISAAAVTGEEVTMS